jgi:hypothetical protein
LVRVRASGIQEGSIVRLRRTPRTKCRLRLELSAEAVASAIDRRLATLWQVGSFIDGPKRRVFVQELEP